MEIVDIIKENKFVSYVIGNLLTIRIFVSL